MRGQKLELRVPDGVYSAQFRSPVYLGDIAPPRTLTSTGLRNAQFVELPEFSDDLLIQITRTDARPRTRIKDTG